eukprot:9921324-Ditylum_brightwellii.AAC.1
MMKIKEAYKSKMYSPIGMLAGAVVGDETEKALEYQDLIHHEKYRKTWTKVFLKEIDQLAQGLYGHSGATTIKYIQKQDVPGGVLSRMRK